MPTLQAPPLALEPVPSRPRCLECIGQLFRPDFGFECSPSLFECDLGIIEAGTAAVGRPRYQHGYCPLPDFTAFGCEPDTADGLAGIDDGIIVCNDRAEGEVQRCLHFSSNEHVAKRLLGAVQGVTVFVIEPGGLETNSSAMIASRVIMP